MLQSIPAQGISVRLHKCHRLVQQAIKSQLAFKNEILFLSKGNIAKTIITIIIK